VALVACDDPSFVVRVHRSAATDQVALRACDAGCMSVDPFGGAPDALTRSIGFFVHTTPETLRLEWSVQSAGVSRCDAFTVDYAGTPLSFDVALAPDAPPSVSGCAVCGAPQPCRADAGDDAGMDAGSDAGVDAGAGPVVWERLDIPFITKSISVVRAFSASSIWAASTDNVNYGVVTFDGGSWTGVVLGADYVPPTDLEIIRSPLRIAVSRDSEIIECDLFASTCLDGAAWTHNFIPNTEVRGLCSDGPNFYAVGNDKTSFGGVMIAEIGSNFAVLPFPSTTILNDCEVMADGTLVATTYGKVGRYFSDGGSDTLPVPGPSSFEWYGIATVGGRTFLAGDEQQVVEWLPDGGFAQCFGPTGPGDLRLVAIGGFSASELFGGGDETGPNDAVHFDGTSWSSSPSLYPGMTVTSITAIDANTWFAGGQAPAIDGGVTGVLLAGHR
jgi:hypothetical protein